jgi:NADPH2:quinone reductase
LILHEVLKDIPKLKKVITYQTIQGKGCCKIFNKIMKAVIITTPGLPKVLAIQEREDPIPAAGEVLIRVHAAGVNRPDIAQRQGNYPAPPGVSTEIPGLEVAGVIEACGPSVKRWKRGDRVCALLSGGGYAELVKVVEGQCLPIPDAMDFSDAAGLPETVFTVWHNVFQRGKLMAGETLLIHGGSSGIGITAIQLAKAFGARVVVTVGSDEKGVACLALGADRYINYKTQDFEAALVGYGINVILDMIGGSYFEKNINLLEADGRLVFINAMDGNIVLLDIRKIMQKRITISGSTLRARDSGFKIALAEEVEKYVWPVISAGNFKSVIHKSFPFSLAAEAHDLMESSEHIGKIILLNEQLPGA